MEQECSVERELVNLLRELPESLTDGLKKLPRTGKSCRIEHYGLGLPHRSVYDHVFSLGKIADIYSKYVSVDVDRSLCAELIAFHDLEEVFGWDVPDFTPESLAGDFFMSDGEREEMREKGREYVAGSLSDKLRRRYLSAVEVEEGDNCQSKFFKMVDKTDPIISIWRHIHAYRESMDIDVFLEAMDDFFTNPETLQKCHHQEIERFVSFIQDKTNARSFYRNGLSLATVRYVGRMSDEDLEELVCVDYIHTLPNPKPL